MIARLVISTGVSVAQLAFCAQHFDGATPFIGIGLAAAVAGAAALALNRPARAGQHNLTALTAKGILS